MGLEGFRRDELIIQLRLYCYHKNRSLRISVFNYVAVADQQRMPAMKAVAGRAKVSPMTVSYALHGNPRIPGVFVPMGPMP